MKQSAIGLLCVRLFFSVSYISAQHMEVINALNPPVTESSGLLLIDGQLLTLNDSGEKPLLYQLDTLDGSVLREIYINDADNVDWEAICCEDTFIYIGDFGNNDGERKDLTIYRVLKNEVLQNDTAAAESIRFNYTNQSDFSHQPFNTNFDAEAIMAYNDSLWIFTKNWKNAQCNMYALPDKPGLAVAEFIDSLQTDGLITDIEFNKFDSTIVMIAYTDEYPFFIKVDSFSREPFRIHSFTREPLDLINAYSAQIEGLAARGIDNYFVTSEQSVSGMATLFDLYTEGAFTSDNYYLKPELTLYQTPGMIYVETVETVTIKLFTLEGRLCISAQKAMVDVSQLNPGIYLMQISFLGTRQRLLKKILLQ